MHCISLCHGHDQVRGHQNVFKMFKVQSDEVLETWSALVTAVTVPVTFLCIMMYQQAISIDFPFWPPLLLVAPAGRRKARIRYRNTTPTNWSTHFVQHPSSATNACSGFILFLPEIWVLEYIYIYYYIYI